MIPVAFSSAFVTGGGAPPILVPSRRPFSFAKGRFSTESIAPVLVLRAAASSKRAPSDAKREPRGITKPKPVSPAMQALVGVPEIPRTQALKLIWAHIKKNNLQDPENKKIIVCDEKLKNIFGGRERVGFLEIAGLLNPHFGK